MSIFLYLICDIGRTEIDVGSRGRSPRNSDALYIKISSDVPISYLFCDTGRSRIGVEYTGGGAPGSSELYTLNDRQMSIFV